MTVLPQNTQNGLRPTQNTQKIFGKHGFGLQCIQCAAKRLQCVQWPKTAGTVDGFYHRTHRTGSARHRTHRKFSESMGFGLQCIQCAAGGGFSVFSGRKRSSVK